MKNLKTETVVTHDTDANKITVTSWRPISTDIWEIMSALPKDGIFEKKRIAETQLVFWPNPGYTSQQVFSMVATAAYIAQEYGTDDLENIWSLPIGEHYFSIFSALSIKSTPKSAGPDSETVEYVVKRWIYSRARIQVNLAEGKYDINSHLNPQFTMSRIERARKALARLKFTDPAKTALTKESIINTIDTIEDDFLPVLERDHEILGAINKRIINVQKSFKEKRDKVLLKLNNLDNFAEAFTEWKDFIAYSKACGEKIMECVNSYYEENNQWIMDVVTSMTPPEEK